MIIDMENNNTSTTTNEGLKEIDKQINPVMYGWRCPVCGRVYSPFTSMCAYCGNNNNFNHGSQKEQGGSGRDGDAREDGGQLVLLDSVT